MKRALKWFGIAAVLLLTVMVYRTFTFAGGGDEVRPVPLLEIDEMAVAERLAGGLRIPTIAYSDRSLMDSEAFDSFHDYLQSNYPRVHNQLVREAIGAHSLLYSWHGSNPALKPIVLMAHMDVVPVTEESVDDWTHGPFNGSVAGDYIWGRGAIDDKASLFSILEAVERLLSEGFAPERTIYLSFGHDEEIGGAEGAGEIAKTLKRRGVEPEFVLDEGGFILSGEFASTITGSDSPVAFVAIAEKGYVSLRLTARGEGGHSSMPGRETTVGILAAAVKTLQDTPLPATLNDAARSMIEGIGAELSFLPRFFVANLWIFKKALVGLSSRSGMLSAAMRTTTAPTIINAGVKDNVIPPTATAVVNFRLAPGNSPDWLVEMVRRIVNDDRIEIEIQGRWGNEASPISETDTPQFALLTNTIWQVFPNIMVVPGLSPGGTDTKHFQELTPNIYRFIPFDRHQEVVGGVHGTNEKVTLKSLRDGVTFYAQLIRNSTNQG